MTPGERLFDAIFHPPRHELTHESDCPACEIAFAIAGRRIRPARLGRGADVQRVSQ